MWSHIFASLWDVSTETFHLPFKFNKSEIKFIFLLQKSLSSICLLFLIISFKILYHSTSTKSSFFFFFFHPLCFIQSPNKLSKYLFHLPIPNRAASIIPLPYPQLFKLSNASWTRSTFHMDLVFKDNPCPLLMLLCH